MSSTSRLTTYACRVLAAASLASAGGCRPAKHDPTPPASASQSHVESTTGYAVTGQGKSYPTEVAAFYVHGSGIACSVKDDRGNAFPRESLGGGVEANVITLAADSARILRLTFYDPSTPFELAAVDQYGTCSGSNYTGTAARVIFDLTRPTGDACDMIWDAIETAPVCKIKVIINPL
jgi:hypothetical protein